jgi:hypothetical protein
MRWPGHVANMREKLWYKNLKERDHLEEPAIDGMIFKSMI